MTTPAKVIRSLRDWVATFADIQEAQNRWFIRDDNPPGIPANRRLLEARLVEAEGPAATWRLTAQES